MKAGLLLSTAAGLFFTASQVGCSASDQAVELGGPGGAAAVRVHLIDSCPAGGGGLKVRMNMDTPWWSGGARKCEPGQTCAVGSGTYLIDHGTKGINFFVGSGSDTATKAEVTYLNQQLTFDISVITERSACPDSCKSSSCCDQAFNHPVKITTTPISRCVHCDGVTCADGFHYSTDNSKQVNATTATDLTVEFCPAAACPSTGWRNCDATEQAVCRNLGPTGGACLGEMTIRCPRPAFGGTHTCHSESANYGTHAPDPATPCGSDRNAYCYVPNQ